MTTDLDCWGSNNSVHSMESNALVGEQLRNIVSYCFPKVQRNFTNTGVGHGNLETPGKTAAVVCSRILQLRLGTILRLLALIECVTDKRCTIREKDAPARNFAIISQNRLDPSTRTFLFPSHL